MRKKPLGGVGVAVTRAEEPGGPLARRLALAGANVHSWQALEVLPPEDPELLARAIEDLESYDWIVFSSPRAVAAVSAIVASLDAQSGPSIRVAAVGGSTTAEAVKRGFRVHVQPSRESFGAAALLADLGAVEEMAGARVLLPVSSIARPDLADGLAALGATVDRVTAYSVHPRALDAARCRAEIASGAVAVTTFTSPAAVASVVGVLGKTAVGSTSIVSIGPTTTRSLRDRGLEPSAEARPSTLDGVVAATVGLAE